MNKIALTNVSGINITIIGAIEKITNDIMKKLENLNEPIYWNDSTCSHYIFSFKINDVWFDSMEITNDLKNIELYAN